MIFGQQIDGGCLCWWTQNLSQVLMDVDCGWLSYDSLISPTVREAANTATNLAKGLSAIGESLFVQSLNSYDISSLDLSLQMYLAMESGHSRENALRGIFGESKVDSTKQDKCPTLSTFSRKDLKRTMSPYESLCTSMLRHVDRMGFLQIIPFSQLNFSS